MLLVLDHVFQTLVIRGPDEDTGFHHGAVHAVDKAFVTVTVVAQLEELGTELIDRNITKWCAVANAHTVYRADLAHKTFEKLA